MKPAETLVANPRPQTSRAVRRTVALGAAAMVLIGLLLLYLLTYQKMQALSGYLMLKKALPQQQQLH